MHETKLLKLDISKSKENLIGSQLFLLIKLLTIQVNGMKKN